MSTFLKLVQDLHREAGAAGVAPTAVTGLSGEADRLVNWVIDADNHIQNLWFNWKFLYKQYAQSTGMGVATLVAPTDHSWWDFDTFKIDGDPLDVVEYEDIKTEVLDTTQAMPSRVIIMPDSSLKFEPVPDQVYAITADYYVEPTLLAANSDISAIPVRFHKIITGRALILYGNYENAVEIIEQGEKDYIEILARLESHQLPDQKNTRYAPRKGGGFEVIAE